MSTKQASASEAPAMQLAGVEGETSDLNEDNISRVEDLHSTSRLGGRSTATPYDQVSQVSNLSCPVCANDVCRECARRSSAISPEPPKGVQMDLGLIYSTSERVKSKDFTQEVRAAMDVEQFVRQADLLLDVNPSSAAELVDLMLSRVCLDDKQRLREARELVFVFGSEKLLARTIQGVSVLHPTDELDRQANRQVIYDHTWMCALCELAGITQRRMMLARLKRPLDMGENSRRVQLFMLLVTPSSEKGTKNAFETGRTFASLLAEPDLRQRLMEARGFTEMKSVMLLKAQQMTNSSDIWRKSPHSYMLDAIIYMSSAGADAKLADDKRKSPSADDHTDASSRPFRKHPRASKLFELMSKSDSDKEQQQQQLQQNGLVEVSLIDREALRASQGQTGNSSPLAGCCRQLEFGKGLWGDLCRRARAYPSDFKDAFAGPAKTAQKTVATTWFLYFGILLPTIAFSSLNTHQTHGHMGDLRKAIIGQAIGGLVFALFGGQPLVIIMTTAPLCLYTKVIHQMCADYDFPFLAMYAAVGLSNGLFLVIYSLFGFSKLMRWCTRSTEEIFALFIVIAFITDAGKDMMKNFNKFYFNAACQASAINATEALELDGYSEPNITVSSLGADRLGEVSVCRREASLLFVLLMLGTVWLATTLYRFNKTAFLAQGKREFLHDYALPVAIIVMSFVGSYTFDDIYVEKFPPLQEVQFERAQVELLPLSGLLVALALGFTLSLLFFMDQNISAAMVNTPGNRLKKGSAYHLDLLVVGILNGFLALYGLPMMHGVLPHSPLHARSLADIEERIEDGHIRQVVVNARETRVTGIVSHVLVLASLLLIPYPIAYIPTAVLDGLFLYMAITSLDGLQLFDRILLLFTEQERYPPNHYIRRCPQRRIHEFTSLQLIQLAVMCFFGFSPFNIVEMFFPVIILLMIPFRHRIVPKFIEEKYLNSLDGKHV